MKYYRHSKSGEVFAYETEEERTKRRAEVVE